MRSFFDGKTTEKSQLDNAALLPIEFRQFVQGVVESHHVHAPGFARQVVVQRQAVASISLCGFAAACMLHQDLPHQLRADGQEVLPVLKLTRALFFEAQISLMHQGRALQGVVRTFLAQVIMRDPPKLVVDEREYGGQGFVVAGAPVCQ